MANKIQYLLLCVLVMLITSSCEPSNSTKAPQIGEEAPNISWTTLSGQKIDLKQFRGSWVLLCYWCSCPSHREDILTVKNVYDALNDKNLRVIVIDDTDVDYISLADFARDFNLSFYLVEDNQESINKISVHTVNFRPIYFLIDNNGNLYAMGYSFQNEINNVIKFLDAVIKVRFNNITVTNITSHEATVSWKTDRPARCFLEIRRQNEQVSCCTIKQTLGTNHKMILDVDPNTTYIIDVVADCLDFTSGGDVILGTNNIPWEYRYTRSGEFPFTTLSNNQTD